MARKTYEVSLTFHIEVEELSDELVHRHLQRSVNYEEMVNSPEYWRTVERQRRLLEAMVEDGTVLKRYVGSKIAGLLIDDLALIDQSREQISEHVGVPGDEENVIMAILDRLEPEDSRFLEQRIKAAGLLDNLDELDDSIQERLVEARMTDVTPRVGENL